MRHVPSTSPLWISFHLEISLIWKLKTFATTRLRIDFHSRPSTNPNSCWIWRYAGATSVFQFSYFPLPPLPLSPPPPCGLGKKCTKCKLLDLSAAPPHSLLKIVRCTFDKHLWRPVAMWKVQHFLHVTFPVELPLQGGVPKGDATLMNCWFCWRQHKSSQYYRLRKVNRVCHLVFVSQHILYGKKVKLRFWDC